MFALEIIEQLNSDEENNNSQEQSEITEE